MFLFGRNFLSVYVTTLQNHFFFAWFRFHCYMLLLLGFSPFIIFVVCVVNSSLVLFFLSSFRNFFALFGRKLYRNKRFTVFPSSVVYFYEIFFVYVNKQFTHCLAFVLLPLHHIVFALDLGVCVCAWMPSGMGHSYQIDCFSVHCTFWLTLRQCLT